MKHKPLNGMINKTSHLSLLWRKFTCGPINPYGTDVGLELSVLLKDRLLVDYATHITRLLADRLRNE